MAAVIVWGVIALAVALGGWLLMVGNVKVERVRIEEDD